LKPAISIITVVKDNKEFIEDAIKSVLLQTYPAIEYIIIDGASTDGTLGIIEKLASQNINDKKISRWISEPDDGIYDAMNKGINISTGDIIGFLHSDDMFAGDNVIEKIAGKFNLPDVNAVYSDLVYVTKGDTNKVLRYWKAGNFSLNSLKFGWMPPHPTFFVRKSLYQKYGLFDTSLKIASDYDMILRLLNNNPDSITYINDVLMKMRLGGKSNRSLKNILTKSIEDYKALKKNDFSLPAFTLLLKNIRKLNQFFYNK
jgi:glycosyltransferase